MSSCGATPAYVKSELSALQTWRLFIQVVWCPRDACELIWWIKLSESGLGHILKLLSPLVSDLRTYWKLLATSWEVERIVWRRLEVRHLVPKSWNQRNLSLETLFWTSCWGQVLCNKAFLHQTSFKDWVFKNCRCDFERSCAMHLHGVFVCHFRRIWDTTSGDFA